MNSVGGRSDGRSGGVVLLWVLFFSAIFSLFVVFSGSLASEKIALYERQYGIPSGVEDELASVIDTRIAVISAWLGSGRVLRHPSEEWAVPGELWPEEMGRVTVQFRDVGSRLSLVPPDPDKWRPFLRSLGYSVPEANRFIGKMLDWIDEDGNRRLNGEEEYGGVGSGEIFPPNAPFRTMNGFEVFLATAEDDPDLREAVQGVLDSITLYPSSCININTASPDLLEALGEGVGVDTTAILRNRDGLDQIPNTQDDRIFENVNTLGRRAAEIFCATISVLEVRAEIRMRDKLYWREEILLLGSDMRGSESGGQRGSGIERADLSQGVLVLGAEGSEEDSI